MLRFIAFSDLHAHAFKYGAKKVAVAGWLGVYNSRLADSLSALDEIREYARQHQIKTVLFGGDLFHRRQVVHTDAFNLVAGKLRLFDQEELYLLVGNHDMGDRMGYVNSLTPLSYVGDASIEVCDSVDYYPLEGGAVLFTVPYTDDVQLAKRRLQRVGELAAGMDAKHKILLAHLGMQGAKVGSDYVLITDSDVTTNDVPYDAFDLCLFGHFHEHQQLFRNGWYIGATLEHNWGDSGGKRGFLDITLHDDGKMTMKRIETSAPKFVSIREASDISQLKENDFVRYRGVPLSEPQQQQVRDTLPATHIEFVEDDTEEEAVQLHIDKLDVMSTLAVWVEAHGRDNEEGLLEMGQQLLAKAIEKAL